MVWPDSSLNEVMILVRRMRTHAVALTFGCASSAICRSASGVENCVVSQNGARIRWLGRLAGSSLAVSPSALRLRLLCRFCSYPVLLKELQRMDAEPEWRLQDFPNTSPLDPPLPISALAHDGLLRGLRRTFLVRFVIPRALSPLDSSIVFSAQQRVFYAAAAAPLPQPHPVPHPGTSWWETDARFGMLVVSAWLGASPHRHPARRRVEWWTPHEATYPSHLHPPVECSVCFQDGTRCWTQASRQRTQCRQIMQTTDGVN